MTHIDNSKIFHDAFYSDANVFVPKNTTLKAGTVLGRDENDNLTAFTSEVEGSEPLYILAQTITNESTSAGETFELVRVCEGGLIDKNGLIFANEDDASDVKVLDALHKNGFRLANVEEQTVPSSFAE